VEERATHRPETDHPAIGRHGEELENMTLEQLDEAFRAGAIDAATLIRLQCPVFAGCAPRP
jgi:hypothetical protein